MGNSLDQIGPIAKTVEDIETVQLCIGGYDKRDATSVVVPVTESKKVQVIGVPWGEIEREGIDAETLARFKESIEALKNAGYEIKDITLPKMKYSLAVYYILMPAEVSTNLSRFDGIRYGLSVPADTLYDVYAKTKAVGFGPETRRRVMLGAYVLSHGYYDAYYRKALLVRDAIVKEFKDMFTTVDVILTPTSPAPAFRIGEKAKDPLAMYLSDIFTVPANIAGIPALSIPNGLNSEGLPLDIQMMAPFGGDTTLFAFGKSFEQLRK
jgi:aspartyl-tRNA(Asn)/glutamyl-tRNA(Gln) amidotransferase subunit A